MTYRKSYDMPPSPSADYITYCCLTYSNRPSNDCAALSICCSLANTFDKRVVHLCVSVASTLTDAGISTRTVCVSSRQPLRMRSREVLISFGTTALTDAVEGIFRRCAEPEMAESGMANSVEDVDALVIISDAVSHVAYVQDTHAGRDWLAARGDPCNSVRFSQRTGTKYAVSISVKNTLKKPTRFCLSGSRGERLIEIDPLRGAKTDSGTELIRLGSRKSRFPREWRTALLTGKVEGHREPPAFVVSRRELLTQRPGTFMPASILSDLEAA